jgi:hypothetical protein
LHCCGYKYKASAHIIYFDDLLLKQNPCYFICPSVFYRESFNSLQKLKKSELSTFQIVCEKINRSRLVAEILENFEKKTEKNRKNIKETWGSGLVFLMKDLAELTFFLYSSKLPLINTSIESLPLRSKFIQQLASRLQLLRVWNSNRMHLSPIYASPYISRSYANSYIRVNSAFFTIFADFLFGLFVLLLLHMFSTDTLNLVHTLGSTIHIEVLESEVTWLMGLPAGFKPNEALDNAVGSNILLLINFWNYVTTYLTKFEAEIVQLFAIFGIFGISFQLAMLSDLIDFCTLHM